MKSPDEEFCKSKFNEFLREVSPSAIIQWREVSQPNEPPDYYLSLDSIEYAVEVTILMESLSVGTLILPHAAVVSSLWRFVDEVTAIAKRDGYLNGTYVVGFLRPIDNFRSVKDQIQYALLDYIKTTQSLDRASEKVIFEHGSQRCSIQKVHNLSTKIEKAGPTEVKWEGEAAIQICTLLEERITDKQIKLRNIPNPKILLLYDSYHFADAIMFKGCLSKLTSLASFHMVFVVQSEVDNFVLHSEDGNWLHIQGWFQSGKAA